MREVDRYKSSIGFVDLLFNILVGFVFLFLVAFLLINPVAKKSDILKKAEFVVQMTWPDQSLHDIDLWVMDSQGNKVGFSNKENGILHLERDDLGVANDTFYLDGKAKVIARNEETTSIRGIMPGTYYVSVHLYSKNTVKDFEKNGTPVTVTVLKINPYRQIYSQTKVIKSEGEQVHFYKFTVNERGSTSDIVSTDVSAVGIIPKFSYRGAGQ